MTELIGANLAALLKERGMSQKELAEAAGLTPASVSRYVNGEREPWPATIAALSLALGVANLRTSSEPPVTGNWTRPCASWPAMRIVTKGLSLCHIIRPCHRTFAV